LNVIEFTSDRKRMTVVVQTPEGAIKVLSKGADSVLLPLLSPGQELEQLKEKTMRQLQQFAQEGLRTLVLVQKTIAEQEYREWSRLYEAAKSSINNKEEKIAAAVAKLENNYELIGATAIEDQLQDEVGETIETIKKAGINFWMLTGDKLETAINIGFSCKVLDQSTQILRIEQTRKTEIMAFLTETIKSIEEHKNKRANGEKLPDLVYAIVVEGEAFNKIM